ncbi:MAG: gamma-glutamylcyclotransferase family protein [Gemmobacter sp.]|nr:gamma-glutamylcyclotransferase family protein [Gemmobacter sp.]
MTLTALEADHFFGYGSLVNRATHAYAGGLAAHLTGWERVWVHTPARDLAFLSVRPASGVVIQGLVAQVPGRDWAALDAREFAYGRHPVTVDTESGPLSAQVYAVPGSESAEPSDRHPILLSYLDAVVQGFARESGPAGVAGFFSTTAGWKSPIMDDRRDPRYPRAQSLDKVTRAMVDDHLAAIDARILR